MQMIFCHTRHPSHLCQVQDSIIQTFLEQFVLVTSCGLTNDVGPSDYQSVQLPILLWLFLKSLKRFGSSRLGVLDQSLQDICLLLLFPYCPWVDILCKPQNAEACKSLVNADRLSRNGVQDSLSSGGALRAVI